MFTLITSPSFWVSVVPHGNSVTLLNDIQQYCFCVNTIAFVETFALLLVVPICFISQDIWLLIITPKKPGNKLVDSLRSQYLVQKKNES